MNKAQTEHTKDDEDKKQPRAKTEEGTRPKLKIKHDRKQIGRRQKATTEGIKKRTARQEKARAENERKRAVKSSKSENGR
jgi:hypothetical protein